MVLLRQLLAVTGAVASAIPHPHQARDAPAPTGDITADFVDNLLHDASRVEAGKSLKCRNGPSLVVDVGYAKYEGAHDATTGIKSWKGSVHQPSLPHQFLHH